ncbi:MAG TPA: hypothetical protein VG458_07080, partial [Solirubrobacterales bacterium]|nr:hypothetical protein [Solirubrobacterales bacterium]
MAIPQATPSAAGKKQRHGRKRKHVWKDKHWRWVEDGEGGWRKQGYIVRHKHRPKKNHKRGPGRRPPNRVAAPPVNPDPR